MPRIENVPTNTVTGLLGVGKTTAILGLLDAKPAGERWAVLVNEFGDVPIDQAVLEERAVEGIRIREVAGGCLCCTAGVPLQVALTLLLREADPDRLLIEMSGMGHPGSVLFTLREGRLSDALDVRATICLVDPRDVDEQDIRDSRIFQDQVHLADVLVANKTDLADESEMESFERWSAALFPPKRKIAVTRDGAIDPAWLDLDADPAKVPLFPDLHDERADDAAHDHGQDEPVTIAPGVPWRSENEGYGRHACGWIFSPADVFDEERLLMVLAEEDDIERVKGAFRVGGESILLDWSGREIETRPTAYARDSRLEIISRRPLDWDALERALLSCIRRTEETPA